MAGRPPKLLQLHKRDGTYRKDRHAKREGELSLTPGTLGEPPDYVANDPEAIAEWRRCIEDKDYAQILAPAHYSALAEYCHLHSRMVASANAKSDAERMTASERGLFHALRIQLARTPASQSKVKVPKAQEPQNKWQQFG